MSISPDCIPKLFKPALQGTVLADLRCDGHADFSFSHQRRRDHRCDTVFRRVSIEDNGRRFALFGLDGRCRGTATS